MKKPEHHSQQKKTLSHKEILSSLQESEREKNILVGLSNDITSYRTYKDVQHIVSTKLFSAQLDGDLSFFNKNGLEIILNFKVAEYSNLEISKATA